jgi:hypothetical protein
MITMHNESRQLLIELMEILETVEVSDNGIAFRPTTIRSCRSVDVLALDYLFKRIHKELGTTPKNLKDYL